MRRRPIGDWSRQTIASARLKRTCASTLRVPVDWVRIVRTRLESVGSVYVLDRPIVFDATKDKPVILSAIGCDADYLVTSDTTDFAHILGTVVYGVRVRTPKSFLVEMGVVA